MKYVFSLFLITTFISCKNEPTLKNEDEFLIKAQLRQLDYKIAMLNEQTSTGAFWYDTIKKYNFIVGELKIALTTNSYFQEKRKKMLSFSLGLLSNGFILDESDTTYEKLKNFSLESEMQIDLFSIYLKTAMVNNLTTTPHDVYSILANVYPANPKIGDEVLIDMRLAVNQYKYPFKFFITDDSGAIIDTVPLTTLGATYTMTKFKKGLNKLNSIGVYKNHRTNSIDTVMTEIQFYAK